MFVDINEYMLRSKEQRQNHLKLDEACIEIGGNSREARLLMAHFLKVTIPKGMKIHLCHACHNGKCSNPEHLYWGTAAENIDDCIKNGRKMTPKGIVPWNKGTTGRKHSVETRCKMSESHKGHPNHNKLGLNQYSEGCQSSVDWRTVLT